MCNEFWWGRVFGKSTLEFNLQGSVYSKYIQIYLYIQKDATLHSLYLETSLHVLGGTSTHHQEHTQLYLLVKPLLPPAAVAAGGSNGLTSTRCC